MGGGNDTADAAVPRWAGWVLFGPAVGWLVVAVAGLLATAAASDPAPDRATIATAGSDACRRCHPQQHATWYGSYHRTMTQSATGEALLAPFAGESVTALGFVATMTGGAEDQPHVRVEAIDGGEVLLDVDVELTVGSHRYQQYVAKIDRGGGPEERWRLPLAWHPEARRWLHLSGAFLTPDGVDGDGDDYLRHLSRWSDNCIFCHNTEPVPGRSDDGQWRPRVAELGIACEACHGRASAHVAKHANPLARLLTARDGRPADNSVVQPDRLDSGRHADVCGRCHGQRIARDIDGVLRHGDGFVPGQPLLEVSRPIVADSQLAGLPERPFADRFWPDGTPRLSAYEYQGLLASPCHDGGRGLSCNDCHTMHGDEPDGQVRPDYSATVTCGGCHPPEGLRAGRDHGGHTSATAASVDCADCHLPHVTYGLLQGMMSHRITSPDPGAWLGRRDQPDACTQCHVTRTRRWAAEAMAGLGLVGTDVAPEEVGEEVGEAWGSAVALDLLGGDPVQRTLSAHALSRPSAVGSDRTRRQWLALGLRDEYPAVRWMAWRGLSSMAAAAGMTALSESLAAYDFMGPLGQRLDAERSIAALLGSDALPSDDVLSAMAADRDDKAIWIGE